MSSRARRIATVGAVTVGAVAVALALPGRERVLALDAVVLLLGAAALTALVRATAKANPASDDDLWEPQPAEAQRVPQLDEIVREFEAAVGGVDANRDLRPRFRIVASALLADRRGIDLDRQPERAHAAIGDELTWELVRARERHEPVAVPALRAPELRRVLDSLERL
jgi:hypothetical protein